MTVLTDKEIRDMVENGWLGVTPFDPSLINPNSLDFRLGRSFGSVRPNVQPQVLDPLRPNTFKTDIEQHDKYILRPGQFVLATTIETFSFNGNPSGKHPFGLAAQVMGKSSLGRLGLNNSSVAGWIDCGFFNSEITLEIKNDGHYPIILTAGMRIGQLVIYKTAYPKKSYKATGRYNNQNSAQGSKGI